jgi:flagellar hook-basal body protein
MKQFSIGLTGLTTHQRALETSANNIANSSTVGYKAGEYLFADQFSTFLSQTDAGKVGQGAMEIGVRRNFSQGSFRKTGSQFDVAISGEGFLVTSPASDGSGQKFLTRNGQLAVDKNRFLVNSNGQFVYGRATYASTGETSSNDLVPMSLPPETIEPQKTLDAKLEFNLNRAIQAPATRASLDAYRTTRFDFNPKDPSSFDYQTSVTVYDSVGAKHELRYYYRRESGLEVNQWAMYTYLDDYALKLDSGGQWMAATPELDPSTGEPRRDVRGAIVQSIYEPGPLSNTAIGDRLNLGVDSSSLIQDGVTLSSGLAISGVTVGDGASVGTASLQVKPDNQTLTMTYNGRVYTATAPLQNFTGPNSTQTVIFENGTAPNVSELARFTLKANAGDITAATAASQLTSSPQTSSLSFAGLTLTSVNFGETAAPGNLYQIRKSSTADTLALFVSTNSGTSYIDTGATAFVGNDLSAGGKTSFAFTVASTNQTIMTVNLQNPTNASIPAAGTYTGNPAVLTTPGLQELLSADLGTGGMVSTPPVGTGGSLGPAFEAKLASVRRPQAVRYIFEVDPTTGTMLDTLDNPVGKIFESLPNGEPDKASGVNGLIPKLSPSFKYTLKMGADVSSIVNGVPFGGTNALLNFEISQWQGTSVNSANSQTKSVQTGGRSLSRLTGLTIDPGGRMVASYSNGDITYGSRLALALVPAENGLIPVGANLYQESYFSGASTIGNPGDPGFGTIRSETVEDSNLDLAQELVKLTQLQRVYQANAKTISSADELLKTLLQI